MNFQPSERLAQMGSAIFAEVAAWKEDAIKQVMNVIDLSIGSPDRPPAPFLMEKLASAVQNPNHYGYPGSQGTLEFRQAVAKWYEHRFGVKLDPVTEITSLMGSQDGLAHLALALTDPGETVLLPNPGYPIYTGGVILAGAKPYYMPLRADNGFLPRFEEIPAEVAQSAKYMLLNYPSNPISAVADRSFFESVVAFGREHDILIVHDLAYSEMAFDGFQPMSILEVEGAKEVAVEFHSLSKSFNMAGCRIAFLAGHPDAVSAVHTLKTNIDFGVFRAVQEMGIAALEHDLKHGNQVAELYEKRRDIFIETLSGAGWELPKPKATMFIWAPIPQGFTSRQISREMLFSAGVVVIPGDAFGSEGEGYIRIALVQDEETLREAARRLGAFMRGFM